MRSSRVSRPSRGDSEMASLTLHCNTNTFTLMEIKWDPGKCEVLKQERGLDFEILAESICAGDVLEVVPNPNYPGQVIFMILVDDYVCAVPAVSFEGGYFLKTAYKSRKLNRRFNGGA